MAAQKTDTLLKLVIVELNVLQDKLLTFESGMARKLNGEADFASFSKKDLQEYDLIVQSNDCIKKFLDAILRSNDFSDEIQTDLAISEVYLEQIRNRLLSNGANCELQPRPRFEFF
jgi:hypothetical protein